ncbi:hypothetical protein FRACA_3290005 [Frankia canadensis]|uniref:Fatty acid desaturase n=1 Tax=Frankia canadensis TaxID=1836972 RepID=A0A2I2KUP7_9ACTN|nr:hypothetical protein [Frankia canadensis]SNQ49396.1 hypothetical protein FRACA_3290005 [Frankia canadensis]SOU56686.1 hypothetical protein FRACA_3290005 [Frankia canadensis]
MAVNIGLLAGGWVEFVAVGNSWWQLATAAFLAVMFTRVAFIWHDAGHQQIFTGRRGNDTVGLIHGNVLVGLSYGVPSRSCGAVLALTGTTQTAP